MSIEQIEVIDAIGIDNSTGHVVLSIIDSLPWDNAHLLRLQDKLNTYLGFIESGELEVAYPATKGRQVQIHLHSRYCPDEDAISFLEQITRLISSAGVVFTHDAVSETGKLPTSTVATR
uniref:DUF6572 domain-containing protein n=1 Tax=Thaumasiovibrio occultus TaxID=1891184 RepID=UPI00186504E7|nr:DUF6572 domain-containing protein [Thaumasiovibrio occultus]